MNITDSCEVQCNTKTTVAYKVTAVHKSTCGECGLVSGQRLH